MINWFKKQIVSHTVKFCLPKEVNEFIWRKYNEKDINTLLELLSLYIGAVWQDIFNKRISGNPNDLSDYTAELKLKWVYELYDHIKNTINKK